MSKRRIKADYFPVPYKDPNTGRFTSQLWRPYVMVYLSKTEKSSGSLPFMALVDSGADNILLPAVHAKDIGIKITSGKRRVISGIAGKMKAYTHSVYLYFEGKNFKANVDFAEKCQTPLLGREGFFNQFKQVSFNEKKRKITFSF